MLWTCKELMTTPLAVNAFVLWSRLNRAYPILLSRLIATFAGWTSTPLCSLCSKERHGQGISLRANFGELLSKIDTNIICQDTVVRTGQRLRRISNGYFAGGLG
ncbi:hypothetical protein EV356DRAFT_350384 [Viridothelium virens]|uniref:Uncharacterized protein n=1 Tax=Viridothelium virens TaxID=1048519 RepID=A0A6A6GX60_VIRVR|nr:hypothetical protein EV356DRAFT_350384 [Viridothelium virens]